VNSGDMKGMQKKNWLGTVFGVFLIFLVGLIVGVISFILNIFLAGILGGYESAGVNPRGAFLEELIPGFLLLLVLFLIRRYVQSTFLRILGAILATVIFFCILVIEAFALMLCPDWCPDYQSKINAIVQGFEEFYFFASPFILCISLLIVLVKRKSISKLKKQNTHQKT
jgi:hypothetical protein